MKSFPLLALLYRWGNQGTESLNNFPMFSVYTMDEFGTDFWQKAKNNLLGFGVTSLKMQAVLNSLIVVNKTGGIWSSWENPMRNMCSREEQVGRG